MTLAQREHPEARAELRAGANWYDDPATGQELLDATLEARESIAEMPGAWPRFAAGIESRSSGAGARHRLSLRGDLLRHR